jgi:hypothetical protein
MWASLFVVLLFLFLIVVLVVVPKPDLNYRIFLPLHGFGQHLRLGALLNASVALSVIIILVLSLLSSHLPVGNDAAQSRLLGAFVGWLVTLLFFSYIISGESFSYEMQWGAESRRLDLLAFVGRWLIRLELAFMLFAALDIFL